MRKSICAVYDADEQYACKLTNVMNQKKKMPFQTLVFTMEEPLLEYMTDNSIDILVISEDMVTDEIKNGKADKMLVLYEDKPAVEISDRYSEEGIYGIYKYQSSENIVREVMNYCEKPLVESTTRADIIGIYSPISGAYKTAFSLALASAYGEKSSVLYINLEEFSGLGDILPESGKGNLSDIIYYYRIGKEGFLNQLEWLVSSTGKINYIPPVKCAEDITYASAQDWIELISYIANNCAYEVIVLDISNAVREQWKLIQICKKVFMPAREDYISRRKINDFESYLLTIGNEAVHDKIEKIMVPYDDGTVLSEDFIEKVKWSRLGAFAKETAYG